MRAFLLIFLSCAGALYSRGFDPRVAEVLNFEKYWNPYVRNLLGCPADGDADDKTCNLVRSREDYANYVKACHGAAKFFRLKDTCDAE